jgi:hypothetical protein
MMVWRCWRGRDPASTGREVEPTGGEDGREEVESTCWEDGCGVVEPASRDDMRMVEISWRERDVEEG